LFLKNKQPLILFQFYVNVIAASALDPGFVALGTSVAIHTTFAALPEDELLVEAIAGGLGKLTCAGN
jgi:hypothetical protein